MNVSLLIYIYHFFSKECSDIISFNGMKNHVLCDAGSMSWCLNTKWLKNVQMGLEQKSLQETYYTPGGGLMLCWPGKCE
jgi:hypothetical protein